MQQRSVSESNLHRFFRPWTVQAWFDICRIVPLNLIPASRPTAPTFSSAGVALQSRIPFPGFGRYMVTCARSASGSLRRRTPWGRVRWAAIGQSLRNAPASPASNPQDRSDRRQIPSRPSSQSQQSGSGLPPHRLRHHRHVGRRPQAQKHRAHRHASAMGAVVAHRLAKPFTARQPVRPQACPSWSPSRC